MLTAVHEEHSQTALAGPPSLTDQNYPKVPGGCWPIRCRRRFSGRPIQSSCA